VTKIHRRCSRAINRLLQSNTMVTDLLYCRTSAYLKSLSVYRRKVRTSPVVPNQQTFFIRLGRRVRELRRTHGHSQEDMISYGFSARHWQQIEAGRPITVSTLLRICAVFETSVERLVRGLDNGIYEDSVHLSR